ncbi:MAG: 2-oxoisovalerate dehydrogenase E1 component [Methyloprofundus sp.]|nr:MAG: 2-oxoisovalerate dehydrogenase E1 component [Methyloprofundus sp.]
MMQNKIATATHTNLKEKMYEQMFLIRQLEETILTLFSKGEVGGTTHTCIGQEAVAVAAGSHLAQGDVVFASHRCHGHFIAYGGSPESLLAEVMGRETGVCAGRGGSQHIHFERFFSNGVQGGIVGNAVGTALALQFDCTENIAVVFLGDGTLGEGLVYESFNFAALRNCPVLFVLENNNYAQSTPAAKGVSGTISTRARAFGIAVHEDEGTNDANILHDIFSNAFQYVRNEHKPFLQIIHTYRLGPHSKGDDTRNANEIAECWRYDPIPILKQQISVRIAQQIENRVQKQIIAKTELAIAAPLALKINITTTTQLLGTEELPAPFAHGKSLTFIQALNQGLHRILAASPTTIVLGEDISGSYGGAFKASVGLSHKFPERIISTPISEAGIVAWATGLALMGYRPIVEIMFGDFLTLAADQILNHACKYPWLSGNKVSMPLVIRTPMGGHRGYGPTHSQSIEKMFLGIPELTVLAPCHLLDPGEILYRANQLSSNPVLFIENKVLYSHPLINTINERCQEFYVQTTQHQYPTLHLSLVNFETPDITLITYGGNVPLAMEVAKSMLISDEIVIDLIIPTAIAPLSVDTLIMYLGQTPNIAVLEEGTRFLGWGAEIVAALAEHKTNTPNRRYLRITAEDCAIPAAKTLEEQILPTVKTTINKLQRFLQ